jgi:glycosyltransferase involved in cell wall biosynthesis
MKIKVAAICDSPFIHTGFGVVADAIMSRWDMEEFEVHVLGTMHHMVPKSTAPYEGYCPTPRNDPMGFREAINFIQDIDPDVLFLIGDPGTLRNRLETMKFGGRMGKLPVVTYFPLEGIPLNPHIIEQANQVHGPVTYTQWGADIMREEGVDVDWAYHGLDHADFRPYNDASKDRLHQVAGWGDKFVVGVVGVNKRSNRQPAVLETAKILKDEGYDDIVFYLHCQEKGDMFMAGWELGWMIQKFDLQDTVFLRPEQLSNRYLGLPHKADTAEILNMPTPADPNMAEAHRARFGFIDMLNTFDLYLDPASVHGFNLPAAEAARCGVPIAMVDDGFARREIYGSVARMMEPTSSDWWHTGAIMPLVSPRRMADTRVEMYKDAGLRRMVADDCRRRFDGFKWQPTADLFAKKIREAHEYGVTLTIPELG